MAFAFRLSGMPVSDTRVRVPTVTRTPKEHIALERVFASTCLDRAVYWRNDPVRLLCDQDIGESHQAVMRLQKPDGRIYVETLADIRAGEVVKSVFGVQLPGGPMQAVLMPP
jgi:hypothetical protein